MVKAEPLLRWREFNSLIYRLVSSLLIKRRGHRTVKNMKSFPNEIERMSLENEISAYRKKSTMVKVVVLVAIFLIAVIAIAQYFGIETSEALI